MLEPHGVRGERAQVLLRFDDEAVLALFGELSCGPIQADRAQKGRASELVVVDAPILIPKQKSRSRSCIIDGEAVACDDNGVASFDLVRHHCANESIFLYAFALIELNGDDLRRDPLKVREATLASIVAKASPGIRFNEYMEGDGPTVIAHACKMGLEGIVSKRKDSAYRSGRSPDSPSVRCARGRDR